MARQQAPQVSLDTVMGNQQKYKEQADAQGGHIQYKGHGSLSQTVQDAGHGGRKIEEGTDKTQGHDKMSRQLTLEEQVSGSLAEGQKEQGAKAAEQGTEQDGGSGGPPDILIFSAFLGFRDDGKQENADGVGDCRRKEDQWQGHTRENAVDAEGCGSIIAISLKAVGDIDGLHALQQIDHNSGGRKRYSHGHQHLQGPVAVCRGHCPSGA